MVDVEAVNESFRFHVCDILQLRRRGKMGGNTVQEDAREMIDDKYEVSKENIKAAILTFSAQFTFSDCEELSSRNCGVGAFLQAKNCAKAEYAEASFCGLFRPRPRLASLSLLVVRRLHFVVVRKSTKSTLLCWPACASLAARRCLSLRLPTFNMPENLVPEFGSRI